MASEQRPKSRVVALALLLERMLDDPKIGVDEIATMVALARHANESGECWPSHSTLSAMLGRSRRYVGKWTDVLEERGYLAKKRRHLEKGGETSCIYRIPALVLATPSSTTVTDGATPRHDGATPRHEGATNLDSHQDSGISSPAGEGKRPEREGEGIAELAWTPTSTDVAFARGQRPDLTDSDLTALALKVRAHHGPSCTAATLSATFRRWTLTERTIRHADQNRQPRQFAHRSPDSGNGRGGTRTANFDRAAAALDLLAAR
jgi:hypothetical protein